MEMFPFFIVLSSILFSSVIGVSWNNDEYKLLCYYGSWSHWNSMKEGRLSPDAIDPFLCTHIIYAFAILNTNNTIVPNDPYLDTTHGVGGYSKVTGLKNINPKLKVLISIGGWNEGSVKYSNMSASYESRKIFIKSVVEFLIIYNFDGIDIDWEYPSQRDGRKEDKQNFVRLLKELRRELKPKRFLLTAAVASTKFIADKSYDVPALNYLLDFVNVMTYDFYGPWMNIAGHHSPLYTTKGDQKELSIESSIQYWLKAGISNEKLIMGVPTYARSFTLINGSGQGNRIDLHPLSRGPGKPGKISKGNGTLTYPEVCLQLRQQGTKQYWNHDWNSPFYTIDDQWVGYENVESIRLKTEFVKEKKLAGAMIWALHLDDVSGSCEGNVKFPLSYTISDGLGIQDIKLPRQPLTESVDNSGLSRSKSKIVVFLTIINSSYKYFN